MNCEKCKNKKATVFYADEGGGRHALCTLCSEKQGKLGNIALSGDGSAEVKAERFMPEHTLTSLTSRSIIFCVPRSCNTKTLVCRGCGTAIEDAIKVGRVGCPDCYDFFAPALPYSLYRNGGGFGRMPSVRKARLMKENELKQLRTALKTAVSEENFELALTIRDKIRAIENT